MYNLLIVDDEIVLLKGLALDIDWPGIGVESVFRAQSAEAALALMEKHRIDIVITDICMPGTSGLQLAEKIRNCWPYCKVILLSGHSNFEYAQKAIACGVFDYVTKPVEYEALRELVYKATCLIQTEIRALNDRERVEALYREALPVIREKYLAEWITAKNMQSGQALADEAEGELFFENYAFLIFLDVDKAEAARMEERRRIAVRSLFESMLLTGCAWMRCENTAGVYVYMVYDQKRKPLEERQNYLDQMSGLLQHNVELQFHSEVTLFWQEGVSNAAVLPGLYQKMIDWISQKLIWHSGLAMPVSLTETSEGKPFNGLDMPPYLQELLALHREEEALEKIAGWFSQESGPAGENAHWLNPYYLVSYSVSSLCAKRNIQMQDCFERDANGFYNFFSFGNVRELKLWCERVIKAFICTDRQLAEKSNTGLVEAAKKIIERQLTEDINVAALAEQLHIHPNYLSRIFHAETGISVVSHIIRLKISRARQLLVIPGSRVGDVAFQLGYESVAHFSMLFKRETGITPKEYQKKHLNVEEVRKQ